MNWTLHLGHALDVLRTLPAESVNCIVTSPPYFGLRDYGTATWEGGDQNCDHRRGKMVARDNRSTLAGTTLTQPSLGADGKCSRCGASRTDQQIGLEPSPDEFVSALVAVFAEGRRVLRDDGTFWLNLGDSYFSNRSSQVADSARGKGSKHDFLGGTAVRPSMPEGSKAKDLIGVPWLAAFALRADGWYLRADIIWHKPNPMPESVQDRVTKAHEYVFHLTKSPRYWYDADAIREAYAPSTLKQFEQPYDGEGRKDYEAAGVQNPSSVKQRIVDKQRGHSRRHAGFNDRWDAMPKSEQVMGGANARSVWSIATQPSPYDHFAVMPKALARRCIVAGCPPGGTVLDPFAGMATTGVVALEEGRSFVGIELNAKYHAAARERLAGVSPLFAEEQPA